jgi:tetratricopeptide (TPR) repeat protein
MKDQVAYITKRCLITAYYKFLTLAFSASSFDEYDRIHQLLRGLSSYINLHASKEFAAVTMFEINRAHALGYFKELKFANAVKYLNPAIASCPKYRETFVGGLSDTLILLAECYSALGRRDDALHSARLAVNISHERLEQYSKVFSVFLLGL